MTVTTMTVTTMTVEQTCTNGKFRPESRIWAASARAR
jgi:hypothetical protein